MPPLLFLCLLLCASSTRFHHDEWVSNNQAVAVKAPLGIDVDYKVKHSVSNLQLQLAMVEELDAVGNKIPSQTLELQQGGEASQWMSSQREGLTGLLERPLNMGHERDRFPLVKAVMFNYSTLDYSHDTTNTKMFTQTSLTETVSVFKIGGWYKSFKICEPSCGNSTYQTPVFGQSIMSEFEIKDWPFTQNGDRLRLTFKVVMNGGSDFSVRQNRSRYAVEDQTPYCRTELNRWDKYAGFGTFTTSDIYHDHQDYYLNQSQLHEKCYNNTYKGPYGLGDDLITFNLEKENMRVRLRCSDHVRTDTTDMSLQTPGLQGPIATPGEFGVVLPKSGYLKYTVMVDMNSGGRIGCSLLLTGIALLWC